MSTAIARLKVVLDDVEPAVMRRIEVPLSLRLDRLHTVLQTALGWADSHLWEFRFGEVGFGLPDPGGWGIGDGPLDARKTTLRAALDDSGRKSFTYLYDFGDSWRHSIEVQAIAPPHPGITYPFLIGATGRCPPEDVGGSPGYSNFLEAIADPAHDRYDELVAWAGRPCDPNQVDTTAIDHALAQLAKRWSTRKL